MGKDNPSKDEEKFQLEKKLQKLSDEKDKEEFRKEIEEYLMKKLEESSEISQKMQDEMVKQHGIWVTMKEAAKIVKRSRSTMYMYKNNDLIIYRQNDRVISVYTRSLIFVL